MKFCAESFTEIEQGFVLTKAFVKFHWWCKLIVIITLNGLTKISILLILDIWGKDTPKQYIDKRDVFAKFFASWDLQMLWRSAPLYQLGLKIDCQKAMYHYSVVSSIFSSLAWPDGTKGMPEGDQNNEITSSQLTDCSCVTFIGYLWSNMIDLPRNYRNLWRTTCTMYLSWLLLYFIELCHLPNDLV